MKVETTTWGNPVGYKAKPYAGAMYHGYQPPGFGLEVGFVEPFKPHVHLTIWKWVISVGWLY